MKKFSKILMFITLLSALCGCEIYVYDFGETNTDSSSSENLTQSGTGSTIITDDVNYTGFINFAETVPSVFTSWDVIYSKVKTSVVTIRNIANGKTASTGSGVFFAEDYGTNGSAYIYTNAHVVKGSTSIEVLLSNGILVKGTLIGYDENEDVAVVQIDKRNDYTIATLRKTETLRIGEEILTIGSPLGDIYSETATTGIISNLNIPITPDNAAYDLYLIQIDAALNPGNSGGPLFDNGGNLIGINTLKLINYGGSTNIESFNYSIPISHFTHVANFLLSGSKYYRPYLNITIMDIRQLNMTSRNEYGISVNYGLLIKEIGNTSPLNGKAQVNQVITHIDGVQVIKSADFSVELLKHNPNETITLTICDANGANSQNINITLLKR